MRGIIIEGVTGSGKSAIYECLRASFSRDSGLLLSQIYTQRLLEHLPSRQPKDILLICDRYVAFLESLEALYQSSVFPTHERNSSLEFTFIFESFHMNHVLEFGLSEKQLFAPLERRLQAIGTTIILLKIPDEQILERSVRTTRLSRGKRWLDYQQSFGLGDNELACRYKLQQRDLEQWIIDSRLPYLIIDTAEENWLDISRRIAQRLQTTR